MFSHVMVGTNDLPRARAFYDALLGQLGVAPGVANKQRYFWRNGTGTFGISVPIDGEPAVAANGGTVGFICQSTQQVDAAHAARLSRTRRAGAARPCIWPICATLMATSSA